MSSQPGGDYEAPSFFSTILKPGSSLHPTFLLILDGAFAALLCIFLTLLFLTAGSIHIIVLIFVELGLWASVKWFVKELQTVQSQQRTEVDKKLEDEVISDKKTD